MWNPEGFTHGFVVLGEVAEFIYNTTDFYAPQHKQAIFWNDAYWDIDWPLGQARVFRKKMRQQAVLPMQYFFPKVQSCVY